MGVELWEDQVLIRPEVKAVTARLGIDPLIAISEGTLLFTVTEEAVDPVTRILRAHHIDAGVIGRIVGIDQGRWRMKNGVRQPLVHPRVDPFWEAFGRLVEQGAR